jgi:hypothetical protein
MWLSSLVLANRIEPADCRQDASDPLCLGNLRLYLPAHNKFTTTSPMVAIFLRLGPRAGSTNPPARPPDDLPNRPRRQAIWQSIHRASKQFRPRKPAHSTVLAMFDPTKLTPGAYTLEVDVQDATSHTKRAGQVLFELAPK